MRPIRPFLVLSAFLAAGGLTIPLHSLLGCVPNRSTSPTNSSTAFAGALALDALLGTSNELKGGTLEKGFDVNSVKPYANEGKITGKIQNKTGQKMKDVVIAVAASAPAGSVPPHLSGGTLSVSGGGASVATIPDGGSDNSSRVVLGEGIDDGTSLDITIQVSAPDLSGNPPKTEATDFKVKITPSGSRDGAFEYDIVEGFTLSTARPQIGNEIGVHGHDAVGMYVKNADGSQRINQIAGTVTFPSGSDLALSQVALYESPDGGAVTGATISIASSSTFTIGGLSWMPGASKYCILKFSGKPPDATSVQLHASFRE